MNTLSSTDLESLGNFLQDLNESGTTYDVELQWDGTPPHVRLGGENTGLYLIAHVAGGYTFSTSEYA